MFHIKNICDVAAVYSLCNNAVSNLHYTASNDHMTVNQWTENDKEGSDKSLYSGTIPAFAWRTDEIHKSIRIVYVPVAKWLIPNTSQKHYCLKQLVCTAKVFTNLHGNKDSEMASYYRIHSYGK